MSTRHHRVRADGPHSDVGEECAAVIINNSAQQAHTGRFGVRVIGAGLPTLCGQSPPLTMQALRPAHDTQMGRPRLTLRRQCVRQLKPIGSGCRHRIPNVSRAALHSLRQTGGGPPQGGHVQCSGEGKAMEEALRVDDAGPIQVSHYRRAELTFT